MVNCPPNIPIIHRNNVTIVGSGTKTLMLAHGFGCDQNMWRFVVPAFENDYRVILFDYVGAGKSDLSQYSPAKYGSLNGYADDVLEIIDAMTGGPITFVGHSVSSMIGVLAAIKNPEKFERLILIGPSPCYINGPDYVGGFSRADIDELLDTLDNNYLGWSSSMAPVIMANPDRPELAAELNDSFCRTDPQIAKQFARVTFLSDNRADLALVKIPTLILQCARDVIAPECVGDFVHSHIADSEFVRLQASGHCPHMSAPDEVAIVMKEYLERT
jgi:sigma-B regulation protein RsbQ